MVLVMTVHPPFESMNAVSAEISKLSNSCQKSAQTVQLPFLLAMSLATNDWRVTTTAFSLVILETATAATQSNRNAVAIPQLLQFIVPKSRLQLSALKSVESEWDAANTLVNAFAVQTETTKKTILRTLVKNPVILNSVVGVTTAPKSATRVIVLLVTLCFHGHFTVLVKRRSFFRQSFAALKRPNAIEDAER